MRQTSYRGWSVSFNRLDRLWYAHDPSRHIRETVVKAPTLEQIKPMVETATPNYSPPLFSFMAA